MKGTSKTMFQCPECELSYTRKSSLSRHFNSQHNKEENNGHICPGCDKTFARHDNLERHKRRFHTGPALACVTCSRKFRRKDYLKKHENLCRLNGAHTAPNPATASQISANDEKDNLSRIRSQHDKIIQPQIPPAAVLQEKGNVEFAPLESDAANSNQPVHDTDALATNALLDGCIYFDDDAPFNFVDNLNVETIERLLEDLAGFDELGRIDIDRWPSKTQPLPTPPRFLTEAIHILRLKYPDAQVEGIMHPYEVSIDSNAPNAQVLEPDMTSRPGFKLQLLPRVRCLDCPNRLYVARSGSVVEDLRAHMENRQHRQSVKLRLSVYSQKEGTFVQDVFHAIRSQRLDRLKDALGADCRISQFVFSEQFHIWNGNTASQLLAQAVSFGSVDILKAMIQRGFFVSAKDFNDRTPLHLACYLGKTEMAEYLVNKGAKHSCRDLKGLSPIDLAMKGGHTHTALQVLRKPQLLSGLHIKERPLSAACRCKYVELVDLLLKDGEDPNTRDSLLPLEVGIKDVNVEIVHRLLEAGADPNLVESRFIRALRKPEKKPKGFRSNGPRTPSPERTSILQRSSETLAILEQYGLDFDLEQLFSMTSSSLASGLDRDDDSSGS